MTTSRYSSDRDLTATLRSAGPGMQSTGTCDRCGAKVLMRYRAGPYARACEACTRELATRRSGGKCNSQK